MFVSNHRRIIFHTSFCFLIRRNKTRFQIGGRGAVTSTVASTKKSVLTIKRRGSVLLARSQGPGLVDFSIRSDIYSPKSRDIPGDGIELAPGMRMRNTSVRGNASGSPNSNIAPKNVCDVRYTFRTRTPTSRYLSTAVTTPVSLCRLDIFCDFRFVFHVFFVHRRYSDSNPPAFQ